MLYLLSVVVIVLSIGENECSLDALISSAAITPVSDSVKKEYREHVEFHGD